MRRIDRIEAKIPWGPPDPDVLAADQALIPIKVGDLRLLIDTARAADRYWGMTNLPEVEGVITSPEIVARLRQQQHETGQALREALGPLLADEEDGT